MYDHTSGNSNVAIGLNSMRFGSSGTGNMALGIQSMYRFSGGSYNVGIGLSALGDGSGDYNVAVGNSSLYYNQGNNNVAVGRSASHQNTTGDYNLSLGYYAGYRDTSGSYNVAVGPNALYDNYDGSGNVAVGNYALRSQQHPEHVTGIGYYAGRYGSGVSNVMLGYQAGYSNSSTNDYDRSVFVGEQSGYAVSSGDNNTGVGYRSLQFVNTGSDNTAVGNNAGTSVNAGNRNTYLGTSAGQYNNGADGNIFLGFEAGKWENGSNKLFIENSSSSSPLIYGDFENDTVTIHGTFEVNDAYSLPGADGTAGQVLATNGSGQISWQDASSGGGGSDGQGVNDAGYGMDLITLGADSALAVDTFEMATLIALEDSMNVVRSEMLTYTASKGVELNGNNIEMDVPGLTSTSSASGGTCAIPLYDYVSGTHKKTFLNDIGWDLSANYGSTNRISPRERVDFNGEDGLVARRSSSQIFYGLNTKLHALGTGGYNQGAHRLYDKYIVNQYINPGSTSHNVVEILEPADQYKHTIFVMIADDDNPTYDVGFATQTGSGNFLENGVVKDTVFASEKEVLTVMCMEHHIDGRYYWVVTSRYDGASGGGSADNLGNHIATQNIQLNDALGLTDFDQDTKIQLEESDDEDKIRFDLAGTEHFVMEENSNGVSQFSLSNNGSTVAIGRGAGNADDGTENQNIFVGDSAGLLSSTAARSVAIGQHALASETTNGDNVAIGYEALKNQNGGIVGSNTAVGFQALTNNTTGYTNTGIGYGALGDNSTGIGNTALGHNALSAVSTANNNLAIGVEAGHNITSGATNIAIGNQSGGGNGSGNTVVGHFALDGATGSNNQAFGANALYNVSGSFNVGIGNEASRSNTSGEKNISIGHAANQFNTTGDGNVSIGYRAGYVLGAHAKSGNVFIGNSAGEGSTGDSSIFIGNKAGLGETESNKLYIENSSSSLPLIYGDFSSDSTAINGTATIGKNYAGDHSVLTLTSAETTLGEYPELTFFKDDATLSSGEFLGAIMFDGNDNPSTTQAAAMMIARANGGHNASSKGGIIDFMVKDPITAGPADSAELVMRIGKLATPYVAIEGRLTVDNNLHIGPALGSPAGSNFIAIENGTEPSASLTDGVLLYAKDYIDGDGTSTSELFVRDEDGNVTDISPHNFSLIPEGPSEDISWAFYSEQRNLQKVVNVDMLKAVRVIEGLSGEKLVHIADLEGNPIVEEENTSSSLKEEIEVLKEQNATLQEQLNQMQEMILSLQKQ